MGGIAVRFNELVKRFLRLTPVEVRRRLPETTFSALDLLLASLGLAGATPTILQVGACDGIHSDPIRQFVIKGHARAILLEPNPFAFERLQQSYHEVSNVTLLNIALAEYDGTASLYRSKRSDDLVAGAFPSLGVASFDPNHLKKHGKKGSEIEAITVPCRSLVSLLDELRVQKLDLLQIDAEGFDAAAVRMALDLPVLPDCINFEHRHLLNADRNPLYSLLKSKGYQLCYDDWNILAVQSSVAAAWS